MKSLMHHSLRALSSVMLMTLLLLSMMSSILTFKYCDTGCCKSEFSFTLEHSCEGNSCCQTSVDYSPQAEDCCESDCCKQQDDCASLKNGQEDCRCHFIPMGSQLEDCSAQAALAQQTSEQIFVLPCYQSDAFLTLDAAAKRVLTQGLRGSPPERIGLLPPRNLQQELCTYLI